MSRQKSFIKNYGFSLILIGFLLFGALLGFLMKEKAAALKPLGDIFLNLLFTIVVPLVFFSISSAVATMTDMRRLGRIFFWMTTVFIMTGIIASVLMVAVVSVYPPGQGVDLSSIPEMKMVPLKVTDQIVKAFTVTDFGELLSKKNMLALIIFALLLGLAAARGGEKTKPFAQFLVSGSEVCSKAIGYIMFYAPIGLGAYFAYLAGVFGPQLLGSYARAMAVYYPFSILYFFIGFSFYAYLAAGRKGIKIFWMNIIPAALTAMATGSSVAAIPSNLAAAQKTGVPKDIREMVIPIGATIHMDGSCLAAVLKIALLFGLFGINFNDPLTIAMVIGAALLSGTVMAGIPGGGFVGEVMIVTLFGFPIEALAVISLIGALVDPPATMVNAVGDNVCSMMIARILGGKRWMETGEKI